MIQYSVQPRYRIFTKGYGFLSFAKNIGKISGKIIIRTYMGNIARIILIMLENLSQMSLKLCRKDSFKSNRTN